jgi:hypothetical protein
VGVETLREVAHEPQKWRFDVEGAPPQRSPLYRPIVGRTFPNIDPNEKLRIEPNGLCVTVPDLVYEFQCSFYGGRLLINGREPKGEPRHAILPEIVTSEGEDGWTVAQCKLPLPSDGAWRVIFWVGDDQIATQTVIAGQNGYLPLSDVENRAFKEPLPIFESEETPKVKTIKLYSG